ncbi:MULTISPECIES: DUF4269 domain-containing protein [unclassified Chryseobacterium]|uniref:DUF4269 domain-containing protein n=1 Tax=unclassified Chryseobacterium TaxID=2593645 RepID=UPI000D3CB2AB|nr:MULTISPECIES: DUF4269 domain-containing protein [unclassified Chryseobacterium]PTT68971.1 DUF4269 domain-containing protein [Chryseobacterium sp. HMWF001]PVV59344.1 DUF4269 domain-containing protein [Chryseobacterium sp. HMWF035]
MIDFKKIDYLKRGNEKQKKAHEVLTKYQILEKLKDYSPILAGTIPIEIDIEDSDLDIICEAKDFTEFEKSLSEMFSEFDLKIEKITVNNEQATVLNFDLEEFPVEIFGQNKPATEQNAYRHMIAEYKILQEKGNDLKKKIIELKKQGIKTEPAFGILLNLESPYEDLLKMI